MARLKFTSEYSHNRETQEIEFKFPDDVDIDELRIIFIRMAYAMGYQKGSIESTFGPESINSFNMEDFYIQIRNNKNI